MADVTAPEILEGTHYILQLYICAYRYIAQFHSAYQDVRSSSDTNWLLLDYEVFPLNA